MTLPSYSTEAEFRERFIAPLLSELGFFQVTLTHGSTEQGKDFVFADLDQFENIRYYALQAKLGSIGAGSPELDQLLNQVRRAFRVRLLLPQGSDKKRVSAVYVMASGSISPQAREYVAEWCRSEPFGENVYLLDGDRLDRLRQQVRLRRGIDRRAALVGLLAETRFNAKLALFMKQQFESGPLQMFPDHCRVAALESYMSGHLHEMAETEAYSLCWHSVDRLNRWADFWTNIVISRRPIEQEARQKFAQAADVTITTSAVLAAILEAQLQSIDRQFAVSVEET